MDAEALNSQVEEKKLRKAKKQSKVAAYGKSPRPGTSQRRKARAEWDKAGQFCFGVGPEAWGVVRQTRLTFGNSGCAEWALSLPWGLLHAPTHHPQVPTRCNMMWWLRYYRRNRQNGQVGWPRKCKFRKQKQQLKKRHELDFWDSDRLWREFPAHLGDNDRSLCLGHVGREVSKITFLCGGGSWLPHLLAWWLRAHAMLSTPGPMVPRDLRWDMVCSPQLLSCPLLSS